MLKPIINGSSFCITVSRARLYYCLSHNCLLRIPFIPIANAREMKVNRSLLAVIGISLICFLVNSKLRLCLAKSIAWISCKDIDTALFLIMARNKNTHIFIGSPCMISVHSNASLICLRLSLGRPKRHVECEEPLC